MRNLYKNILYAGLLALCIVGLSACEDEEVYDFPGSADNIVYILPATKSFNMVSTPVGFFGDSIAAGFGVKSTQPSETSATVTAVIDTSLVSAYNEANGTNYMTCTASLSKATATINQGEYASFDSIEVVLPKADYSAISEIGTYLVPVKLSTITTGVVSTEYNIVYLEINVEQKLIKEDAGSGDIQGTLVADRSAWTATSTDASVTNFSSVFDGNAGSGVSFGNEASPTITIDMQDEKNVSAFYFKNTNYSWYNWYNFSNIYIELSTDGTTWTEAGTAPPHVENTTDQYIILYGAVPSRYVRITVSWLYGDYGSIYRSFNEFNVYAN